MTTVKVMGARRSGTTVTSRYLEWNFDVNCSTKTPHKHGTLVAPDTENFDAFIVSTRNPFAWLASAYNWINEEPTKQLTVLLIGNWAAKHSAWLDFAFNYAANKTAFVQSERWIEDPEEQLAELAAGYGWRPQHANWKITEEHPSPRPDQSETSFDPTYYKEAQYMEELQEHLDVIMSELRRPWVSRVTRKLGYKTKPPGWDWDA